MEVDSVLSRCCPGFEAISSVFPTYTLLDQSLDGHAVVLMKVSQHYSVHAPPSATTPACVVVPVKRSRLCAVQPPLHHHFALIRAPIHPSGPPPAACCCRSAPSRTSVTWCSTLRQVWHAAGHFFKYTSKQDVCVIMTDTHIHTCPT